ncbi:MAG: hypothetical protein Q4C34_04340 [Bacteroidales bacterium]|nr:hypothetical protein [Bacteroidales bacterium]
MTLDEILEMTEADAAGFKSEDTGHDDRFIETFDRKIRRRVIPEYVAKIEAAEDVRDDGSSPWCEKLLYVLLRHYATGDRSDRRLVADALYDVYTKSNHTLISTCRHYLDRQFTKACQEGMELLYKPEFAGAGLMVMCMFMLFSEGYVRSDANAAVDPANERAVFYAGWASKRDSCRSAQYAEDMPKLWSVVTAMNRFGLSD